LELSLRQEASSEEHLDIYILPFEASIQASSYGIPRYRYESFSIPDDTTSPARTVKIAATDFMVGFCLLSSRVSMESINADGAGKAAAFKLLMDG
jgi:hypothetical protein